MAIEFITNVANLCRYNEKSKRVYNFFKMLREHKEEYQYCYKNLDKGDEVERARKFFVVVNQSFNGSFNRQTGWKMSTIQSRTKKSEAVNRWLTKLPNLDKVAARLREVQLSNWDFSIIFKKFNNESILLYCDPPYIHNLRSNKNEYEHEMTDNKHVLLCQLALKSKSYVAISGYENDIYNNLLGGFYKTYAKEKRSGLFHSPRREVLWTNYNPDNISLTIFNQ